MPKNKLPVLEKTPAQKMNTYQLENWLIADDSHTFAIRVASNLSDRLRAYQLARRLYGRSGFIEEAEVDYLIEEYDFRSETLTLIAEDDKGQTAATMTLVCDDPQKGLPADSIFKSELDSLRKDDRRLAEGTRLAVADDYLFSPNLVFQMLNLLYIYGRQIAGATDLIIEINPRHVGYYRRNLGFHILGEERPCSRVNGAPARLLYLPIEVVDAEFTGRKNKDAPTYPALSRFYDSFQEMDAVGFFRSNINPLQQDEARMMKSLMAGPYPKRNQSRKQYKRKNTRARNTTA